MLDAVTLFRALCVIPLVHSANQITGNAAKTLKFAFVKIFGMSIFDLFDYVSSNIFLPVGGMFISLFTGWYLDKKFVRQEITNGGEIKAPYFRLFIFILRYVAPVAIALILLNQLGAFALLK